MLYSQNDSPKNNCNNSQPTIITRWHPQSVRINLELAVIDLKPSYPYDNTYNHSQNIWDKL